MLKIFFVETINAIIRRSLVWNDNLHTNEKLICNCKIKQFFIYNHIKTQCLLIIKCGKYAKLKYLERNCNMLRTRTENALYVKTRIMFKTLYEIVAKKIWKRHENKSMFFFFFIKTQENSSRHWFNKFSKLCFLLRNVIKEKNQESRFV